MTRDTTTKGTMSLFHFRRGSAINTLQNRFRCKNHRKRRMKTHKPSFSKRDRGMRAPRETCFLCRIALVLCSTRVQQYAECISFFCVCVFITFKKGLFLVRTGTMFKFWNQLREGYLHLGNCSLNVVISMTHMRHRT
jgi:hypothetical protein